MKINNIINFHLIKQFNNINIPQVYEYRHSPHIPTYSQVYNPTSIQINHTNVHRTHNNYDICQDMKCP